MARYDRNKNYYQILGVSESATTSEILSAFNEAVNDLKEELDNGNISKDSYDERYEDLTEAADVLSDASVRKDYDADRAEMTTGSTNNKRQKVTGEEDGTKQANKGRGCLVGVLASVLAVAILTCAIGAGVYLFDRFNKKSNDKDLDNKPGIEQMVEEEESVVKNFGDPTNEKDVLERVVAVKAQLNDLGVVNPQTGLAYTDEELTAIIQYMNGAFKPEKEADAYTMVDEYLNFVAGIISAPKTLNMIQYQANSDVVSESIVRNDINSAEPFDFNNLLMGDSYCHEVIVYFNDLYGKLLSTTDREEYKAIHNEAYVALANLMYGDGLNVNGKIYTIRDFEGLGNQNDAVVFGAIMYNIMPFHVQGIDEEFNVYYSQAGDIVVPIKQIDEQFNVLCSADDLKITDEGLVTVEGTANFATNTQVIAINAALQNYGLDNTDAYANGYQYTKKENKKN